MMGCQSEQMIKWLIYLACSLCYLLGCGSHHNNEGSKVQVKSNRSTSVITQQKSPAVNGQNANTTEAQSCLITIRRGSGAWALELVLTPTEARSLALDRHMAIQSGSVWLPTTRTHSLLNLPRDSRIDRISTETANNPTCIRIRSTGPPISMATCLASVVAAVPSAATNEPIIAAIAVDDGEMWKLAVWTPWRSLLDSVANIDAPTAITWWVYIDAD